LSIADLKEAIRPTAAEVAEARERDPGEGMVAALVRTAMATVFTLAEEGITLGVTRGTLTNEQYLDALWPPALALAERQAPGSRAHMAAELLGMICTLFDHWRALADRDLAPSAVDFKSLNLSLAIGYRAGMLTLDEAGLFDVAGKAEKAKQGRSDAIRKRNLEKTAWHEPALALARRHRQTFPHRATAQIASVIDNDASIHSPSPTQVLETLREWERTGKLPKRKRAGEK